MSWFGSLPPVDTQVPCGNGMHTVRWERGQLSMPSHLDAEAELVLGALGGDKPGCVAITETWARHVSDLAVLAAGPRSAADRVEVSWEQVAEQRAGWPGLGQGAATNFPAIPGRVAQRAMRPGVRPPVPGVPAGAFSQPMVRPGRGRTSPAGMLPPEYTRRAAQRMEVFELLALGTAFQFRLSGTVAASWAAPGKADARAHHRPELTAALSGRLAPAAAEWLGIDPDAVTVTPHEGPGWGTLNVTGTGAGARLTASLPVGWLSSVWACGLAVAGGHLVVAVEQPGFPRARVLALRAPGAVPVQLGVEASPDAPDGIPRWSPSADWGRGLAAPPARDLGQWPTAPIYLG